MTDREILALVIEGVLLAVRGEQRRAGLELALRRKRVLGPGELEMAARYLNQFPDDDAARVSERLAAARRGLDNTICSTRGTDRT